MEEDKKITTMAGICTTILREIRAEKQLHQAQIADFIGKTPSAWTKIESGKSPLQFDVFFRVCNILQVPGSWVIATAERYAALMSQNNWVILSSEIPPAEDELLLLSQQFWKKSLNRLQIPILNTPIYDQNGLYVIADVFRFALDRNYRDQFIEQMKHM